MLAVPTCLFPPPTAFFLTLLQVLGHGSSHLFGQKTLRKKNDTEKRPHEGGGGDPGASLQPETCLPLRCTQTQGFPAGVSPRQSSGSRVHLVTCVISRGSVRIFPTHRMSGSSKPSASQPRKEMEVSFFFSLHVSLPLPSAGELNVLTLEERREPGAGSNAISPR